MATDHPATLGAFPLSLFHFQELIEAIVPNVFEVLDQAHSEMRSVSLVYVTQPLAGEIIAFVTIFHLAIQE